MKAVLIFVITWTFLVPGVVTTAQVIPTRASWVSVRYVPPKNAAHQPISEELKELRFLEKLQELLSPFRLPGTLLVQLEGCDGDANASYENAVITVCYEYVDQLWKTMPVETTVDGVAPNQITWLEMDGWVASRFLEFTECHGGEVEKDKGRR
jgi:hypothetical protein